MNTTTTEPRGDLRLDSVTKRFGDFTAVDDLTLTVPQGSFFALLGPPAAARPPPCGWSPGWRAPPPAGSSWASEVTDLQAYRRPVNTVFQQYALFPH